MRGFVIAGSVVVLGLLAAMFGSTEPVAGNTEKEPQEVRRIQSVESVKVASIKPAEIRDLLDPKLALDAPQDSEVTQPDFKELSLTERLDDFFLNNVVLENLPLGQAMAMLKQMLLATDKQKALALHKLIVSIPTAALGRLVTLHSSSISYLEAVQTLATMAGCDVELGTHRITLKTQPGPWPQVATKRSLLDMLDGILDADGRPLKQDANQVTWLRHDARRLGLKVADNGEVSMTESQWQALRRAQEYRRRLELSLIPPYAVYVLPESYLQPILQVTPQQVLELMTALTQQGYAAYSDVPFAALDPTVSHQILTIMRMGETVLVTMYNTSVIKPEVVEEAAASQHAQTALRMEHAAVYGGMTTIGGFNSSGASPEGMSYGFTSHLQSGTTNAAEIQIIELVPVDPSGRPEAPPETPPTVTEMPASSTPGAP